jgi:hypothetical protein
MLLFFIFLVLISATAASIALYLGRRKSLPSTQPPESFNPPPTYRSLFAPDEDELRERQQEEDVKELAELRRNLLRRAAEADFNSLLEAKFYGNTGLYDEVLQVLLDADADRLADFVRRNSLTGNGELVELSAKKLKETPVLDNLLTFAYLSAVTGSGEVFLNAIETIGDLWREKRLREISGDQLTEILESHYWLLAGEARVSGTGYLLKEKLTSLRAEISGG